MASWREANRTKELGRKAKLKGTSLARSQRPPPRPHPHHASTSGSQAGSSYLSHRSQLGSHRRAIPMQEGDLMEADEDPDEDLNFKFEYGASSPPSSRSTHQAPPLLPVLGTCPATRTSPQNPPLPSGPELGELEVPYDPHPVGSPPPPVEPSDSKDVNETNEGNGNDGDDQDIRACESCRGDESDGGDGRDGQGAGMADVEEEESEEERPWFLAIDDDWQAPSPAGSGLESDMDEEFIPANPSPSHSPPGRNASLHTSIPSPTRSQSPTESGLPIHVPRIPQSSHPSDIYIQSHPVWFIRIILILTVYLHFSFHLPFAACNILLFCLSLILRHLNLAQDSNRLPISLATAIKSLHLKDQFVVYPACPTCHRIETTCIPATEQASFTCTACDGELFSSSSSYDYLGTLLKPIAPNARQPRAQPKLVVSYRPIPTLLSEFLSRDGMVEKVDAWRTKDRVEGRLEDVMDGRVWKELEGPDKKPFFGNHCPEELRIGLVVQLDWCNFRRSAQSTHHSTGLFSISVANLPESERYQTKNLLVPCIIPGPKEPNTRQLQEYIILMVDEFLQLYEHGMDSPASPNRLVRVAVTLVICDHPAMCKFFGLADKRHENSPCHRCNVKASEWWTEESLSCGCRTKTFEELRDLACEYQRLSPEKQEQAFKQSGVRWFAFLKLPYFNPLRMAVLDPMHNILLGVVKTQWYDIWIKQERALRETTKDGTRRELEDIHSLLRTAEFPDWLGRIPSQIGIPAGGSLSADEWKVLVLVFGPLALPVVWDDWIDSAESEVQNTANKASEKRRRVEATYEKEMSQWEDQNIASQHIIREQAKGRLQHFRQYTDADIQPPPEPPDYPQIPDVKNPRLKRGEMELFLKLSAALTVLLARTVYLEDLEVAHQRLVEYLWGYVEMYGPDAVKPNFHWATHLYDQILDYGPVYGFWAFLQERLNFIVKSFRTNNHGQGELEVTMMRSYSALTSLRDILASTIQSSPESRVIEANERFILGEVVNRLLADPVARGTLEVTAQSAGPILSALYTVGPQKSPERLDAAFVTSLFQHINSQPPFIDQPVLRSSNPAAAPGRIFSTFVIPITYMVLDGRRITASDAMRGLKRASIVQARWDQQVWVGELLKVFVSLQEGLSREPLAAIRWLKPANTCPLRKNIWIEYSDVLDVRIWEHQVFLDDVTDEGPPAIIPFSNIISQAARITVRKAKGSSQKLWLTIGLDKHGTRL